MRVSNTELSYIDLVCGLIEDIESDNIPREDKRVALDMLRSLGALLEQYSA